MKTTYLGWRSILMHDIRRRVESSLTIFLTPDLCLVRMERHMCSVPGLNFWILSLGIDLENRNPIVTREAAKTKWDLSAILVRFISITPVGYEQFTDENETCHDIHLSKITSRMALRNDLEGEGRENRERMILPDRSPVAWNGTPFIIIWNYQILR